MKAILTAAIGLMALGACAQSGLERAVQPAALLQDFDSLHSWIVTVHPKLYANADSAATEAAWRQARKRLTHPMTEREFRNTVAPLVHQYNDGHTFIEPPMRGPLFDSLKKNGTLFPIPVKLFGNNLVTLPDSASLLPAGSTLTAINGVGTADLLRKTSGLMSGDNAANRAANLCRLFPLLLWTAYGWQGPFEVAYKTVTGEAKHTTLAGIGTDAFFKRIFPSPLWTMALHPTESLAVIECAGFNGNMDRIRQKLDSFFAIIKQQGIRHVALDLRRNGGGNSYIGELFLSYVNIKPYQAVRSKSYRNSWAVQNIPESDWRKKDIEAFKARAVRTGGFLTVEYAGNSSLPFSKPAAFFDGSFYLLTSPRTYSSAHITASQVKCGRLGTIIGQPTGEQVDLTGEIKDFKLPNTGLEVWIPMAMYTAACPLAQKVGVQPDYTVPAEEQDAASGMDAELAFLKRLIRRGR